KLYLKIKFIKKPRTAHILSVLTSVFLFILIIGILISLLVYSVTNQLKVANFDDIVELSEQFIYSIDSFYRTLLEKLDQLDIQSYELDNYFNEITGSLMKVVNSLTSKAISSISNISEYFTTIFFAFIVGIYLMFDGEMIKKYIRKVFYGIFNKELNVKMKQIVSDLDMVFSGYIRGQLTDALFITVVISISLSIINVKFALLIGVLTGIGNLVPYMGPIVAYFCTTVVCLVNGDYKALLIAVIVLAVVQAIDGNIVGPKLLSNAIEIHPLLVIVSLIFGSAVGGFMGMLLAVPVGAYIKVVFVRFIDKRIEKKESLYGEKYIDE
ncbi:MAG TPA: AI-2E family transporter, partial [Clostridiales bacterium]|nr:AI-2E family transporter [Clostridiales bacterium]